MTAAELMGRTIAEAAWDRADLYKRGMLGPRRLLRWETSGDAARASWTKVGEQVLAEARAAALTDETAQRMSVAQSIFGALKAAMRASENGLPGWAAANWGDGTPDERADYFAIAGQAIDAIRLAKTQAREARAA
jgi:hypothetical protein